MRGLAAGGLTGGGRPERGPAGMPGGPLNPGGGTDIRGKPTGGALMPGGGG